MSLCGHPAVAQGKLVGRKSSIGQEEKEPCNHSKMLGACTAVGPVTANDIYHQRKADSDKPPT